MSLLGLVPGERSTGDTVRRKGLTLAGNRRARRALIEAAWTYRYPARVSETLRARLEGLPKPVRDIAWKGQVGEALGENDFALVSGTGLTVGSAAISGFLSALQRNGSWDLERRL